MVLPAGINKAAGLAAALQELDLSPHNVVGGRRRRERPRVPARLRMRRGRRERAADDQGRTPTSGSPATTAPA